VYAPLSPLSRNKQPSAVGVKCLNWCLFKIMLMSGVVKVQARCPTWMGLTALVCAFVCVRGKRRGGEGGGCVSVCV